LGTHNNLSFALLFAYFPFLFFLFDPVVGFVPPLRRVASMFFTSDCIGELDGLFVSALETGLDFVFGLRLLTPLRPMLFS
jgi:hypothetical protein